MGVTAEGGNQLAGQIASITAFVVLPLLAYWIPTFIALARHVPAKAQVVVVNLFLGWTVIGWVVALVMALRAVPPAVQRPRVSRSGHA
jgi:hypothetical protein